LGESRQKSRASGSALTFVTQALQPLFRDLPPAEVTDTFPASPYIPSEIYPQAPRTEESRTVVSCIYLGYDHTLIAEFIEHGVGYEEGRGRTKIKDAVKELHRARPGSTPSFGKGFMLTVRQKLTIFSEWVARRRAKFTLLVIDADLH
jgi:hypothetical protein